MREVSQSIRHESRVVIREYMHKTEHGHFIDVLYLLAQHRNHSRYIRPERSHYRPLSCDLSPSLDNGSRLFSFEYGDQEHVARKRAGLLSPIHGSKLLGSHTSVAENKL